MLVDKSKVIINNLIELSGDMPQFLLNSLFLTEIQHVFFVRLQI